MSAIWGIIERPSNTVSQTETLFNKMTASMSVFSFERINTAKSPNGLFACGHQYITKEDEYDISPIRDESEHLVFCSDCFLYNREELIRELDDNGLENAGDSMIAFKAFQKWGYNFVQKLRGIFSFVIYEEQTGLIHLYSDHFTRKYMVYSIDQNYVYFSTTHKPVLACLGNNVRINREFICNCFSDITPRNFHKEAITPYENVFHMEYASHITIDIANGTEKHERYWKPLKTVKKLKLASDEEYKIAFRKLFEKLVRSMLRSKDETGIQLSGGLDSSSVAAFAAPILKERGKNLYSYTQVPSSDYVSDTDNPGIMINEAPLVELQKEFHKNLIPRFISGDNNCCVSNLDYFQNLYDMPIKAILNLINISNMNVAAKKDNCSIVLSGGNGNATISFGYLIYYLSMNVSRFHFIKALKAISSFNKHYHASRLKYLKNWIRNLCKHFFSIPKEDHFFLKSTDEKKYRLTHPTRDAQKRSGSVYFCSFKHWKNFLISPMFFVQKAAYFTTSELEHHYISVDPTLTVEMTEFCLSLPLECYVHNGIERCLVRDYLKDLMPPAITDMRKPFGVQTADFDYRVNRDIDKLKDEVFNNLDEPLLREYLDPEKINPLIKELKDAANTHSLDKDQCIMFSQLASLGGFLRDYSKT